MGTETAQADRVRRAARTAEDAARPDARGVVGRVGGDGVGVDARDDVPVLPSGGHGLGDVAGRERGGSDVRVGGKLGKLSGELMILGPTFIILFFSLVKWC